MRRFATLLATISALFLAHGCQSGEPDGNSSCNGGKCDDLDESPLDSPCDGVLIDRSGRGELPAFLANDPFVSSLYMDDSLGCPTDAVDIFETLKEVDSTGCVGGVDGVRSRVVTEQGQLDNRDVASYRVVTTRQCNSRTEFGLMFSMFGFSDDGGELAPDGDEIPRDGLEIIAFSEADGVFNYYKEVDGQMGYFGNSLDYVKRGPLGPDIVDELGCANCHTGGGLIMKELRAPWVHWEGTFNTPDADALINNRRELLGNVTTGINLEGVVRRGNMAWNEERNLHATEEMTLAEQLKPLFCPVEVNVASGSDSRIPSQFMLDRQLSSAGNVNVRRGDYENLLLATDSQVIGIDERDARAQFTFIERSGADLDFVNKLVDGGIIDNEFRLDVLAIDFTRPVLSDDRCDLLEFAPDLDPRDRDPDSIRDGFIAMLQGQPIDTPAGQLLANLEATAAGAPTDHTVALSAFGDACRARQADETTDVDIDGAGTLETVSAFHLDAFKLRALQRKIVMEDNEICEDLNVGDCFDDIDGSALHVFRVFEFQDTLPFSFIEVDPTATPEDQLFVHPDARFSPTTCEIINEFEPIRGGGGVEASLSCESRCGFFDETAACQCDDQCAENGDCCEDRDNICAADDSCIGRCDSFDAGASCQCDSSCEQFDNCCDDFVAECSAL